MSRRVFLAASKKKESKPRIYKDRGLWRVEPRWKHMYCDIYMKTEITLWAENYVNRLNYGTP